MRIAIDSIDVEEDQQEIIEAVVPLKFFDDALFKQASNFCLALPQAR